MRAAGYALLGFVAGAAAGFILALLSVVLWYDVLQLGPRGGDGLSGLASFLFFAPTLSLVGGCVGAAWLGRRAGGQSATPIVVVLLLLLFVLLALFATFGVVW